MPNSNWAEVYDKENRTWRKGYFLIPKDRLLTEKDALDLLEFLNENPVITHLELSDCNDEVVKVLSASTSLNYLKLKGNLGEDALIQLAANKNFKWLLISDCFIGKKTAEAFSNNTNLIGLELESCQIDSEIAIILANTQSLRELNLSDNHIGVEGLKALAKAPLKELIISDNNIGDQGVMVLADSSSIKHLVANRNNIGFQGARALANNPVLDGLSLCENPIGNDGALLFMSNTSIRTLWLHFTEVTTQCLFEFFKYNTTMFGLYLLNVNMDELQLSKQWSYRNYKKNKAVASGELDLSNQYYSDRDIPYLIAFLNQCLSIKKLTISRNSLSGYGLAQLVENTALTELKVDGNKIGDEIKEVVFSNSLSLNMDNNQIGPEAAATFIDRNPNLLSISLEGNNIPGNIIKLLQLKRLVKQALKTGILDLSGKDFTIDQIVEVCPSFNQNPSVTTLDISNSLLCADFESLAEKVLKNSTFTALIARGNKMNKSHISALVELKNITLLDLANNEIDDEGIEEVLKLPNLRSLDISKNRFGILGLQALGRSKLLHLFAKDNGLIPHSLRNMSIFLENKSLLSLELGFNDPILLTVLEYNRRQFFIWQLITIAQGARQKGIFSLLTLDLLNYLFEYLKDFWNIKQAIQPRSDRILIHFGIKTPPKRETVRLICENESKPIVSDLNLFIKDILIGTKNYLFFSKKLKNAGFFSTPQWTKEESRESQTTMLSQLRHGKRGRERARLLQIQIIGAKSLEEAQGIIKKLLSDSPNQTHSLTSYILDALKKNHWEGYENFSLDKETNRYSYQGG